MAESVLEVLHHLEQSPWLDFIERSFGPVVGAACRKEGANVAAADADPVVEDLREMMP